MNVRRRVVLAAGQRIQLSSESERSMLASLVSLAQGMTAGLSLSQDKPGTQAPRPPLPCARAPAAHPSPASERERGGNGGGMWGFFCYSTGGDASADGGGCGVVQGKTSLSVDGEVTPASTNLQPQPRTQPPTRTPQPNSQPPKLSIHTLSPQTPNHQFWVLIPNT